MSVLLFCIPIAAILMETPLVDEMRGGVAMLSKCKVEDVRNVKAKLQGLHVRRDRVAPAVDPSVAPGGGRERSPDDKDVVTEMDGTAQD